MSTRRTLLLSALLFVLASCVLSSTSCRSSPGLQTDTSASVNSTTKTSDPYFTGVEIAIPAQLQRFQAVHELVLDRTALIDYKHPPAPNWMPISPTRWPEAST